MKKKLSVIITLALTALTALNFPRPAYAAWKTECRVGSVPTIKGLECLFEQTLGSVFRLLGIAVFIMIIVAAIKLLTSGGNPDQQEAAQKTLTWAIGGLVVAIFAWFILQFIANVTGLDSQLLEFNVNINP